MSLMALVWIGFYFLPLNLYVSIVIFFGGSVFSQESGTRKGSWFPCDLRGLRTQRGCPATWLDVLVAPVFWDLDWHGLEGRVALEAGVEVAEAWWLPCASLMGMWGRGRELWAWRQSMRLLPASPQKHRRWKAAPRASEEGVSLVVLPVDERFQQQQRWSAWPVDRPRSRAA